MAEGRGVGHPFTMDGHMDAIYYAAHHGGTESFFTSDAGAQVSLAGLRAGEVDAAFFAIFGLGETVPEHHAEECAGEVEAMLAGYQRWTAAGTPLRAILTAADLEELAEEEAPDKPFGVLIHCEGARGIRNLDHLHQLHGGGLRSVGLTWNYRNAYAAGAKEDPGLGLSAAGRELVRELEALHMVIDAAHLNRQGFADLLEVAQGPVVVTHTACAAFLDHPRNVTDDQIRQIAGRGGVIGLFYAGMFMGPPGTPITIDSVLAQYDHLINLAGIEHVGLGTDYGGIDSGLPHGLERTAQLPALFAAMREHGYREQDIAAIRGGNYRRVLGQILA